MERVWLDGIMNIAILGLTATSYGSYTYLKNLLPHLAQLDRSNHYEVFLPAANARELDVRQANFRIHVHRWPLKSGTLRVLWEQLILPWILRARGVDVVYTTHNMAILLSPASQHYHHAECRALLCRAISQPAPPSGAALAAADDDGVFPSPQPQDHRHFRLGEGIPGRALSPARR